MTLAPPSTSLALVSTSSPRLGISPPQQWLLLHLRELILDVVHKGCQYLMKNATKGLEDPPSCKCKMPQSSFSSTALMEMVMMLTMERRPTWQLPLPRRPWLGGPWEGGRATQYHRRRTQRLETVSSTFLFVWVLIVVSLCCGRHCHKQIRRLTLLFYCVHMFKTFADRAGIKRSNFCEHRSSFLC